VAYCSRRRAGALSLFAVQFCAGGYTITAAAPSSRLESQRTNVRVDGRTLRLAIALAADS
jgi:hypothetical protein